MTDCQHCKVFNQCHYPHKPCDRVHLRKFWSAQQRATHDNLQRQVAPETIDIELCNAGVIDINLEEIE